MNPFVFEPTDWELAMETIMPGSSFSAASLSPRRRVFNSIIVSVSKAVLSTASTSSWN